MKPAEVANAMAGLIHTINKRLQTLDIHNTGTHPLTIATDFHQEFLNKIHPFSDGNGRIGRIFTNLILLKNGFPLIFIKEVNKNEYLKIFELSDIKPDAMLDFMADRLLESLEAKLNFVLNHNSGNYLNKSGN